MLDLWESARNLDEAIGWVTSGIGRRLSTAPRLRTAAGLRHRLRWRAELAELLSTDEGGIHSSLEYRYVRGVERPHHLPPGTRQARSRRDGRSEYRDTVYDAYALAVELDGKVAHPGDTRWNDIHRDKAPDR